MLFERWILDIIEEKKSFPLVKSFLYGASTIYRLASASKHIAHEKKWLKAKKASIPVISIGNIVAGGTGKTPLVRLLAAELVKDKKVAILTRGYRSAIEHSGEVVEISSEIGARIPVALCGDEPRMLAVQVPEAQVWVGKDRKESARRAAIAGADVAILDDGMQYRSLERNFEIVSMDAEDLFGKGYFLPRGFLRDHPRRLSEADLIVVNPIRDKGHYDEIQARLSTYTESPIVGMRLRIDHAQEWCHKKIGAFCALAKPDRFFATLKQAGSMIVHSLTALDHMPIPKKHLENFSNASAEQGAEVLVCTEKDWVKLPEHLKLSLPIVILKTSLEIVFGQESWQGLIQKIKNTEV
ncbi:MAG TPA: tetraacyldisaccharide 4'-kinase [Rhabdochlamydiaceae bacterium]|nr:tetraacyldisaccharide 4'-kinase [Rhabdochlamydiaceae bacterium]